MSWPRRAPFVDDNKSASACLVSKGKAVIGSIDVFCICMARTVHWSGPGVMSLSGYLKRSSCDILKACGCLYLE